MERKMEQIKKIRSSAMAAGEKPGKTLWDDLPDECWEIIFSYLNVLMPVSRVCKRFFAIYNMGRTTLTIIKSTPPTIPPSLFSRFTNLTTLHLDESHPNVDYLITKLAASALPLQSLSLSDQTHFPRKAMRLLGGRMGKTLRSLSCDSINQINQKDLFVIAENFSYLTCLSVFNIHPTITDETFLAISTKLISLHSLTISPYNLSRRSVHSLSCHCPLLSHLEMSFHGSMPIELEWFSSFTSLTSLQHKEVSVSGSGSLLRQWPAANLKLLSKLVIHGRHSIDGSSNGLAMCRFLKSCISLTTLELNGFKFSAETKEIDFLGSIAKNIKAIEIYHCTNLPKTMTLFSLLKRCPKLERVTLDSNIDVVNFEDTYDLPVHHHIRSLTTYAPFSLKTLMLICSACPSLQFFDINDNFRIRRGAFEDIVYKGYFNFDSVDFIGNSSVWLYNNKVNYLDD